MLLFADFFSKLLQDLQEIISLKSLLSINFHDTTNVMSGKHGQGWSEAEVTNLCSAWLCISEDASVGTGQKVEVFWGRICEDLEQQLNAAGLPLLDKKWTNAQAKFGAILRDTALFAAKF